MKKGKSYRYSEIEALEIKYELFEEELGENRVGENFIILSNDKDKVASFVLSGATATEYIYECIYSDFK